MVYQRRGEALLLSFFPCQKQLNIPPNRQFVISTPIDQTTPKKEVGTAFHFSQDGWKKGARTVIMHCQSPDWTLIRQEIHILQLSASVWA